MTPVIRAAAVGDAAAIAAIYRHHVLHGTATFDTVPPEPAEMAAKIAAIGARGWPFLVAEANGAVAGYAYATRFRDREAYRFTCENSIYIADAWRGRRIGTALLHRLLDEAAAAGFGQMIAVAGGGEPASIALHAAAGFVEAGRMRAVGFKFGRWLDTVYMQRSLASASRD